MSEATTAEANVGDKIEQMTVKEQGRLDRVNQAATQQEVKEWTLNNLKAGDQVLVYSRGRTLKPELGLVSEDPEKAYVKCENIVGKSFGRCKHISSPEFKERDIDKRFLAFELTDSMKKLKAYSRDVDALKELQERVKVLEAAGTGSGSDVADTIKGLEKQVASLREDLDAALAGVTEPAPKATTKK